MFISFRIQHLRPATALALFMAYAAMLGLMLSSVLLVPGIIDQRNVL
jgi:FtsH-binding integral membrane protein